LSALRSLAALNPEEADGGLRRPAVEAELRSVPLRRLAADIELRRVPFE